MEKLGTNIQNVAREKGGNGPAPVVLFGLLGLFVGLYSLINFIEDS